MSAAPSASSSRPRSGSASKPKPPKYPFYLGGVAACFASFATHPLDCIKNRMQTSRTKQGMWGALTDTARNEGMGGLYAGLTASLLRQMTYSVVRCVACSERPQE
jgi:dicarboxylate transporter 10